jgi:hypothetical protein
MLPNCAVRFWTYAVGCQPPVAGFEVFRHEKDVDMQFRTAAIALLALVASADDLRPAMAEDTFYDLVISDLDLGGAKYPELVAKPSGPGRRGWVRPSQLANSNRMPS